jgi:hypothetical protein
LFSVAACVVALRTRQFWRVIKTGFFQSLTGNPLTRREWVFYFALNLDLCLKGAPMPEPESKQPPRVATAPRISIDILSVATGLALAVLVWLGALKHIPW